MVESINNIVITSTAQVGDAIVTNPKIAAGVLNVKKVAETIISGSAATSISFTGLTGKRYLMIYDVENAHAVNYNELHYYMNADTTANHYKSQELNISNAGTQAARPANAYFVAANPSMCASGHAFFGIDFNGHGYAMNLNKMENQESTNFCEVTWDNSTMTAFSSIAITGNQANGLAVGSKAVLYEVIV